MQLRGLFLGGTHSARASQVYIRYEALIHPRALRACTRGPPKDWRRRTGRPRQTWLRTVEDDLLNFGLATARRRAMDRPAWRLLVDAATSS